MLKKISAIEQSRENRIFDFDQRKMYAEFNEDGQDHVMYHMLKKVKDNHESKT